MAFWNVDNPLKPWGYFDPNAVLDFPFDWTAWLADIGETINNHQMILQSPLELVTSFVQTGQIVVPYIKVQNGQTLDLGRKYSVTCRITTTGAQPRTDDRTVFLKALER